MRVQRPPECKRTCALIAAALTLAAVASWGGEGQELTNPAPLRVAFSGEMFTDLNENDAGAALRVWAQMLGKDRGIPVDPAVRILRGISEIKSAIRNKRIDVITLTTPEYQVLREEEHLGPHIFGGKRGTITEEYVLLAHQGGSVADLESLRGRALYVFQNPRASLAMPWLDSLLRSLGKPASAQFFGKTVPATKLTRALLPVFFRQADACVVTRDGFNTACELNPQLSKQLRILAASPKVVPVVFCFRGDYKSPFRDRLLVELPSISATPAGQQFLTLFQCDSLEQGEGTVLESGLALLADTAPREAAEGGEGRATEENRNLPEVLTK